VILERYLNGIVIKNNRIEGVRSSTGGKITVKDGYREVYLKDINCIQYDNLYLDICNHLKNTNYTFIYDIDEMISRLENLPLIVRDDVWYYYIDILSNISNSYISHLLESNNIFYTDTDVFYYEGDNLIFPELEINFRLSKIDYMYIIRLKTAIIYKNNKFEYKGFRKTFKGNDVTQTILNNVRKDKLNNLLDV